MVCGVRVFIDQSLHALVIPAAGSPFTRLADAAYNETTGGPVMKPLAMMMQVWKTKESRESIRGNALMIGYIKQRLTMHILLKDRPDELVVTEKRPSSIVPIPLDRHDFVAQSSNVNIALIDTNSQKP